jgi:hypothetical protein
LGTISEKPLSTIGHVIGEWDPEATKYPLKIPEINASNSCWRHISVNVKTLMAGKTI